MAANADRQESEGLGGRLLYSMKQSLTNLQTLKCLVHELVGDFFCHCHLLRIPILM